MVQTQIEKCRKSKMSVTFITVYTAQHGNRMLSF